MLTIGQSNWSNVVVPKRHPPISVPAVVLSPLLRCYTMMGARRWFLTALRTILMGSLFKRHSRMLSFVSLTSGKWRMILAQLPLLHGWLLFGTWGSSVGTANAPSTAFCLSFYGIPRYASTS